MGRIVSVGLCHGILYDLALPAAHLIWAPDSQDKPYFYDLALPAAYLIWAPDSQAKPFFMTWLFLQHTSSGPLIRRLNLIL